MNDESMSDVSSNISDMSYLSDLDEQCQSVNFDLSNGSPINVNNFNIVHYNINSITADFTLVEHYIPNFNLQNKTTKFEILVNFLP